MDDNSLPRICILQQYLPPDPSGAGKQAVTLASKLRENGYEVFLLGDRSPERPVRDSIDGIPACWVSTVPPQAKRRQILAYWMRLAMMLIRCRKDFDVLHIHAVNFFHAMAIPLARLLGKLVVVRSSLEGDLPDPSQSKSEWLHYICLRLAESYVVISRRLKQEYLEGGIPEDKIKFIPNGVDTNRYAPISQSKRTELRREMGYPTGATILTYHGVFVPRKSLDWVLPIIEPYLLDTNLALLLIGSAGRNEAQTRYFQGLKKSVARSPARDSITLTGFKEDVYRDLQASDLYLLPSTGEGLPNALLEAMAVGLIPIVSSTSGSEEVVDHGTSGFLFEPRSKSSFTRSLEAAIEASRDDRGRTISRNAVGLIQAQYSIEAVAKQYGDVYREALPSGA